MNFLSIDYIVFLPLVFAIYWCLQLWQKVQNIFLLVASYVFYAMGDWRFLGLLWGMSLLSLGAGQLLNKDIYHKRYIVFVAVLIDLSVLGFFKYFNFFAESFAILLGTNPDSVTLQLILPMGISFFTFQAIAYVVDVYKGKISVNKQPPVENLIECLLYISFFPKLLAGPIERPSHLLPQIQQKRIFIYELGVDGCRQIIWGLFKKLVIADNCAVYVDNVWGNISTQSGSTLLLAAILYTIQIYGDFSGYSDIAIGSAKLLGFRFRDNFLFPYFSRNVAEFWKRWHVSLNTWFVDYVYIPLGGSRNVQNSSSFLHCQPTTYNKFMTIRNTMVIFLLSGLWHGADWTFVAWGGYHGLLLVLLILLNRNIHYEHVVADKSMFPNMHETCQMLFLFVLVTIGWILFRSESFGQLIEFCRYMLSESLLSMPDMAGNGFLFLHIVLMFVLEWTMRHGRHGMDMTRVKYAVVRYAVYLWILFDIFAFGGRTENFIYQYF